MEFTRLPDWKKRLTEYIEAVNRASFRPGKHDCALFAAWGVRAMTGVDPAEAYAGKYKTLEEGMDLLAEDGFKDHIALAASLFPEIPPFTAQPGDIAVVEGDYDLSLGIVQGPYIYVLGLGGLGSVPLTEAKRAFRV